MTRVTFFGHKGLLTGFVIEGHTTARGTGQSRIVCAGISSAAYMAANTLAEILKLSCDTEVKDGFMAVRIPGDAAPAQPILAGLRLHLEGIQAQHPRFITIFKSIQEGHPDVKNQSSTFCP